MYLVFLAFLSLAPLAFAGSSADATDTPSVVAKMVQGLADSKIDELTSKVIQEKGGPDYSYHLKIIDYLGTVQRDGRRYTIAAAKFIRSRPQGHDTPPARGHGFLLVFDDAYRVVTHGRMGYGERYMSGDVLKAGETIIADFGTKDPAIRYHGWVVDGGFMPYPFADKISEAEWNSGSSREKP